MVYDPPDNRRDWWNAPEQEEVPDEPRVHYNYLATTLGTNTYQYASAIAYTTAAAIWIPTGNATTYTGRNLYAGEIGHWFGARIVGTGDYVNYVGYMNYNPCGEVELERNKKCRKSKAIL